MMRWGSVEWFIDGCANLSTQPAALEIFFGAMAGHVGLHGDTRSEFRSLLLLSDEPRSARERLIFRKRLTDFVKSKGLIA